MKPAEPSAESAPAQAPDLVTAVNEVLAGARRSARGPRDLACADLVDGWFTALANWWRVPAAPEPAETGAREPDAMCHATHWRRHLDEWGDELTVRSYDPEKCSGEGPPWPVWIGAAPTAAEPEE